MDNDELLTIQEAASKLRIGLRTAYKKYHKGILKGPNYTPIRVYSECIEELLHPKIKEQEQEPILKKPNKRRPRRVAGLEFIKVPE